MAKSKKDNPGQPPSTVNKKAFHSFELTERFEAGISLTGSEVKSLRAAQADLDGSYARIQDDECWLVGAKIAQYEQAGINNHDPDRRRKLLLHKAELHKIRSKLEQRGFTLVPLKLYFNERGLAKAELALAKGKRQYDKRDSIMKRDQRREMDRDTKRYRR